MTVGHVARAIHAIGIQTETIYIEAFLPDAQFLKPARTLVTANVMGRPLGLPYQREQQMAIICAALEMLKSADHAPTLKLFPS